VEPNSLSTEEVDTGIHVRTEDIQSLDEDSSSLRDYSDIDPDYEAVTRSCPLPDSGGRSAGGVGGAGGAGGGGGGGDGARGGLADYAAVPGWGERAAAATLPRSHTVSPVSSSGGSGGGMVRMTSFAEQKFRKLEGRSSGGTTPESSELNMASHPRPVRALSAEVNTAASLTAWVMHVPVLLMFNMCIFISVYVYLCIACITFFLFTLFIIFCTYAHFSIFLLPYHSFSLV